MTKSTHLAAGVAFAVLCSCNAPATVLVCVGSLLPDIDTASSTFGKKVKIVSKFFKHRGFTHSLLFALITAVISPYLCIGVLSHIIMDMFNPNGVELLFPFCRNLHIPLISKLFVTGSKGEKVFRILLYILIAFVVIFMMFSGQGSWREELQLCWENCKTNFELILGFFQKFLGIASN